VTNPKVVPLLAADIPRVAAIEAMQHAVPWSAGSFADALTQGWHSVIMKDHRDTVLGYYIAMTAGDDEELLTITIHPDATGQGYGKTLMQHLLQAARQRGAARIYLEVRASNTRAIGLYEQLGFKMTGMRKNYYAIPANLLTGQSAGREDACLMVLSLHGDGV
jgi:[ribosomal protein S18]-alanine N-acetyltransferase